MTATRKQPTAQAAAATSDDEKAQRKKTRQHHQAAALCYALSPTFSERWASVARERGLSGVDATLTRERQIVLALLAYEADAEGLAWTRIDAELVPMSGLGRSTVYDALAWVEDTLKMGARAPSPLKALRALAKHVGDRRYLARHPSTEDDERLRAKRNEALQAIAIGCKVKAPTTTDVAAVLSAASWIPTDGDEWTREFGELVRVVRASRPRAALRSALASLAGHVAGSLYTKGEKKTPDALEMDAHAAAIDQAWRDARPDEHSDDLYARGALERGDKLVAWLSPKGEFSTRLRVLVATLRAALEAYEAAHRIDGRRHDGRTFNVLQFSGVGYAHAVHAAAYAWFRRLAYLTAADLRGADATTTEAPTFDRWTLHVLLCQTANKHGATWETDPKLAKLARRSTRSFQRDVAALKAYGIVRVAQCRKGSELPDGTKVRARTVAVRGVDFDRLRELVRRGEERATERPLVAEPTSAGGGANVHWWRAERPLVAEDSSRSPSLLSTGARDVSIRSTGTAPPTERDRREGEDREREPVGERERARPKPIGLTTPRPDFSRTRAS